MQKYNERKQENNIFRLVWHVSFPDVNLIDNIWSLINQKLKEKMLDYKAVIHTNLENTELVI